MTISSTGTRYSYSGNGATTAFSFPRQFFADVDLDVYLVDNTSKVATLQVLSTHYTVAGAGSPSGGTVNMLAAPATGKTLVIVRDTAGSQGLDLDNVTALPMTSLEAALDRAMMFADEIKTLVARAIGYPVSGITTFDPTLPEPVANQVIGINATGNGLALKPPQAWTNGTGAPGAGLGMVGDYYLDTATGDVYLKTGASTWTLQANMRGPQGIPGSMTGPGSSAAGNLPTFASTSGTLLQDSGVSMAALMGYLGVVSVAGTTILTVGSAQLIIVTGTLAQTIQLPATSTLLVGRTFEILNLSTGNVTVQTSTAVVLATVTTNATATFSSLTTTGNTATDWQLRWQGAAVRVGTGSLVFNSAPTISQIALTNSSGITAGTNAQGQGVLTETFNVITTAAASPSGVTLPTPTAATGARPVIIVNKGANPINVYPASGGTIDALAANASIQIAVGGMMMFWSASTTQWYSSINWAHALSFGTGNIPAGAIAASTALTTPALSAPTFSTSTGITAGTNTQGQGALTADLNVINTAAANPSGVTLPTATQGRCVKVINKGANPIAVFPATGAAIDGLATNASILVPVGGAIEFNATSTTQWYSSNTGSLATDASGNISTPVNLTASGNITINGPGGLGYSTGSGGTVTQLTSKATGVTLNKTCGLITMNNAALGAGANVTFLLTNSTLATTDQLLVLYNSGGAGGSYRIETVNIGSGAANVKVTNISAGSLSEPIVISFMVLKGVSA